MKIGLYLQEHNKRDKAEFDRIYNAVKQVELDLFVFPELCHTPFSSSFQNIDIFNDNDRQQIQNRVMQFSKDFGCAIIVGGYNNFNGLKRIYNIFANAFAVNEETTTAIYVKHTATEESPLSLIDYKQQIDMFFPCIVLKGKKLGITNCYDCNHAAFSRVYGKKGIDILINSTGGNVKFNKWYRYNKARAIENNAFSFCTMGHNGGQNKNSFTFGFDSSGKAINGNLLLSGDRIGNIALYDTDDNTNKHYDELSKDRDSINNLRDYSFDVNSFDSILKTANKLEQNLFVLPKENKNIVFCILNEDDIMKPEKVLRLMYHEKLKNIKNKRYIVVNCWKNLDETFFETVLSDLLRVRSMENYCAVVLIADKLSKCFQCTRSKDSQSVKQSASGIYEIDLQRTKGAEVVWSSKLDKVWRKGYESLIEWLNA